MNPGMLRHRVTLQRVSETQTDSGFLEQTWNTLTTRWASIDTIVAKSGERFENDANEGFITHRVFLRWYELTSKDRLLFGTRVFNIKVVSIPLEIRGDWMELLVEEVVQ